MSGETVPVGTRWSVGFDDERIATFGNEESALSFAHFDSQLEGVTAVVMRHDVNGTATVIASFVRPPTGETPERGDDG